MINALTRKPREVSDQTEIKFHNYKEFLKNNKTILGLQQTFRSETLNVSTEMVSKINDNKRIQTPDEITSYSEEWIW